MSSSRCCFTQKADGARAGLFSVYFVLRMVGVSRHRSDISTLSFDVLAVSEKVTSGLSSRPALT